MTISELVRKLAEICRELGWVVSIFDEDGDVIGAVIGDIELVTAIASLDAEIWMSPPPDDEPIH